MKTFVVVLLSVFSLFAGQTKPPQKPTLFQSDIFSIDCTASPAINCLGGIPQTVFSTTKIPLRGGLFLCFRAFSQIEPGDYTHTINPDGTWLITFTLPADSGNVVFIYQIQ